MQKTRVLGLCLAAGGLALLTGCVAVPGDPYYSGGYSDPLLFRPGGGAARAGLHQWRGVLRPPSLLPRPAVLRTPRLSLPAASGLERRRRASGLGRWPARGRRRRWGCRAQPQTVPVTPGTGRGVPGALPGMPGYVPQNIAPSLPGH